jgi:hypothetical protein
MSTETTTENGAIRLSYGVGWGLYWTQYAEVFFKEGMMTVGAGVITLFLSTNPKHACSS